MNMLHRFITKQKITISSDSCFSPESFLGQKAQCSLQATPCRQQHSVYVVLRSDSGLAHMLSPSSCCQQISTCTSSSESTTSGMSNEKGLTEKIRESEKYHFKSQLTKLYFFFEYPRRINCQKKKKLNRFVCVCHTLCGVEINAASPCAVENQRRTAETVE